MPALTQAARDYEAQLQNIRGLEAAKKQLEYEKLRDEMNQRMLETPEGRITQAEELTKRAEQIKQQREGVAFGDVAKSAAIDGGMNLLQANKAQAEYNINQAVLNARQAAIQNILTGEKSLLPTATVDIGGIKRTVPATQAGQAMGDAYDQTYQTMVPKLANTYMAEGHDRDTAYKMASVDARNSLLKERSQGNVTIMSSDMQTSYPIPYAKAEAMWRDPKTPQAQRVQLNKIFGEPEQSTAGNWIKTRLGK